MFMYKLLPQPKTPAVLQYKCEGTHWKCRRLTGCNNFFPTSILTRNRGFQTRVIIRKLQSKVNVQFNFKTLWKKSGEKSLGATKHSSWNF